MIKKKILNALRNCSNKKNGRNVKKLYFPVLQKTHEFCYRHKLFILKKHEIKKGSIIILPFSNSLTTNTSKIIKFMITVLKNLGTPPGY